MKTRPPGHSWPSARTEDKELVASSLERAVLDPDLPRPWYVVVLGALPARQALECLSR